MKRNRSRFLKEWLTSDERRPLVLRGARQVGKTWIVRELAKSQEKQLIEINFEKRPEAISLFSSNNPSEILTHIGAWLGKKINPSDSLLFLDEIQAAPSLLAKLRWFSEDMPQLPVIAAGSLLDFALADLKFSMPVGRISYLYLEPLSFEEFLEAIGQGELRSFLLNYGLQTEIPDALHHRLIHFVKEYLIVGGMPAAVASWKNQNDLQALHQIQYDLLTTYREDFSKYRGRLTIERLEEVLHAIPRRLNEKFVYSKVNSDVPAAPIKQALELLIKARVCHRIVSTSAGGLPLGAEANEKCFKVILLDCGLVCVSLGLSLHQLHSISDITLVNNGAMAEQFVGQQLRTIFPAYAPPALYYWQREKTNSSAEIDYLLQHENQIIPIEVKAGTTGSLKSLREFVKEKKIPLAVRINSDKPSIHTAQVPDLIEAPYEYKLLSLPFYLLSQAHRLLKSLPT